MIQNCVYKVTNFLIPTVMWLRFTAIRSSIQIRPLMTTKVWWVKIAYRTIPKTKVISKVHIGYLGIHNILFHLEGFPKFIFLDICIIFKSQRWIFLVILNCVWNTILETVTILLYIYVFRSLSSTQPISWIILLKILWCTTLQKKG